MVAIIIEARVCVVETWNITTTKKNLKKNLKISLIIDEQTKRVWWCEAITKKVKLV